MRTWAVAGAVSAARVSRFADLGDGRRPSVSGESLEAPGGLFYVCEQTVRFPLLGCPRVRSGRRAVQAEHVTVSSVFEHAWQSATPPLSVLLQGSTFYQLLLESVCCTPAFSDARARPVIGASFLEVWVGVWPTRGAPIIRAFARLTWIYTYRA